MKKGGAGPVIRKRKGIELLVRLSVVDMKVDAFSCTITVRNAGNAPCFNGRIDLFKAGALFHGQTIAGQIKVGTTAFALGIQEQKEVRISRNRLLGSFGTFTAIAYDPILDPFPVSRVGQLTWHDVDLLTHDIGHWTQIRYPNDHHFANGSAVDNDHRTWSYSPLTRFGRGIPHDPPAPSHVYFPGTPPANGVNDDGRYSEIQQVVHLEEHPDHDFIEQESAKGNLSARLECDLVNWDQDPRDQGGIAISVSRGGSSVGQFPELLPTVSSYAAWTRLTVGLGTTMPFDRVTARLCARRRTGNNSDSYFGNVRCLVLHRQVARRSNLFLTRFPLQP
ncbi:MAG: hypothetical protein IPM12_04865 [Flavobacteriales bacterium]|nr:hypothetical protein [Flavobacteriales bacterium]